MAEWKLVDAWELGYEYECSNCKGRIDTKRNGEALPGVCPCCDSDMNGKEVHPMSEATCTRNYEAEYERIRAELCKVHEEVRRYKTLWETSESERIKLQAQMEVVRLIFGKE